MSKSRRSRPPQNDVRTEYFPLTGGLNLVDAPLAIKPGMVLTAINYELQSRGGYRRIDGIERYDGQASPSAAQYWVLNFDTGDISTPVTDGFVTGVTSGATGKVERAVLTSGSWAGGDAVGYLVVLTLTGSFTDDEALTMTDAGDGFGSGFSNGFG